MSVLTAILAENWAITGAALDKILKIASRENDKAAIEQWKAARDVELQALEASQGKLVDGTKYLTVRDGVGILSIRGPIFRYANLMTDMSGATSLGRLSADYNRALNDPAISSILLDIDSPGGQVNGTGEFAEMIANPARDKPVIAYVGDLAASAAYWIASAADEIVLFNTASVGSIGVAGVVTVQADRPGLVSYEFVSSQSPRKRPNPDDDEGRAQIQAGVDRTAQEFVAAVARNRGVSDETVLSDFGGGDTLTGSDAVSAGMADRVATFEQVLGDLAQGGAAQFGGVMAASAQRDRSGKETHMTIKETAGPAADNQPAAPEGVVADTVTMDIHKAQLKAAKSEAATAERGRILGVEAQTLPGHEALIDDMKADGTTTPEQAAVRILQAEKAKGAERLQVIQDIASEAPAVPAAASASGTSDTAAIDAQAPVEDRAKAEWDKDSDLRAEYGGRYESYLAFKKADETGRARILKK